MKKNVDVHILLIVTENVHHHRIRQTTIGNPHHHRETAEDVTDPVLLILIHPDPIRGRDQGHVNACQFEGALEVDPIVLEGS